MRKARLRRPGELGFTGILLALALLVLSFAYGIAGFAGPSSAGVFPMLAGLAMVGSAIVILLDAVRMRFRERLLRRGLRRRDYEPSLRLHRLRRTLLERLA